MSRTKHGLPERVVTPPLNLNLPTPKKIPHYRILSFIETCYTPLTVKARLPRTMYEYQALSVCFILFVNSCVLTCVYDMQQYMAEKVLAIGESLSHCMHFALVSRVAVDDIPTSTLSITGETRERERMQDRKTACFL